MKPLDIKDENLKRNGGNPIYGKWITGICPNCGQKLLWENEEKESNI